MLCLCEALSCGAFHHIAPRSAKAASAVHLRRRACTRACAAMLGVGGSGAGGLDGSEHPAAAGRSAMRGGGGRQRRNTYAVKLRPLPGIQGTCAAEARMCWICVSSRAALLAVTPWMKT